MPGIASVCPTCGGPASDVLCARGAPPGAKYVFCQGDDGLVRVDTGCTHPRTYTTEGGSVRCADCYVPVSP